MAKFLVPEGTPIRRMLRGDSVLYHRDATARFEGDGNVVVRTQSVSAPETGNYFVRWCPDGVELVLVQLVDRRICPMDGSRMTDVPETMTHLCRWGHEWTMEQLRNGQIAVPWRTHDEPF